MNLIQKFKAPTPKKNKRIGRVATIIAGAIGAVLTTGVVTAPVGITILTVAGAVASSVAVVNGSKVDESEKKDVN